jgi:hypothetical protein
VSTTSIKILQAAVEITGSNEALAERLGIGLHALMMYMEDRRHLPDPLLLRVVDVILEDRQSRIPLAGQPALPGRHQAVEN